MGILTKEEFNKLTQELHQLKQVERPRVARDLKEAISQGDLSENAAYADAKERQIAMDARIGEVERKLASAEIAEDYRGGNGAIRIGSTFRALDKETDQDRTFSIVGPEVSSPANGKISFDSPLGRAFLNKRQGDVVEVTTPGGKRRYAVLEIM